MGRFFRSIAAAAALCAAMLTSAWAADPSYLVVGGGSWSTLRDEARNAEFDIAYRPDYKLWIFKPHVGFLAAGDGDVMGYAGILTDIYWGPHLVTTLSTSAGVYGGHGFDLGSTVEFRSGIDVAWRFADTSRLGVSLYHISNAGITNRNPGTESVLLQYWLPIHRLFGR